MVYYNIICYAFPQHFTPPHTRHDIIIVGTRSVLGKDEFKGAHGPRPFHVTVPL